MYGKLFLPQEKTVQATAKSSPTFSLRSLGRLEKILISECLIKFHHGGDISIITSWLILKLPLELNAGTEGCILQPGRLLIPLKENENSTTVFIPCGGPDPDTDEIPSWCKLYDISDIINVKAHQLQYRQAECHQKTRLHGYKK